MEQKSTSYLRLKIWTKIDSSVTALTTYGLKRHAYFFLLCLYLMQITMELRSGSLLVYPYGLHPSSKEVFSYLFIYLFIYFEYCLAR